METDQCEESTTESSSPLVIQEDVWSELSRLYSRPRTAAALLSNIGFPREYIPLDAGSSAEYWDEVRRLLDDGVVEGNALKRLIQKAKRKHPGNQILKRCQLGQLDDPQLPEGLTVPARYQAWTLRLPVFVITVAAILLTQIPIGNLPWSKPEPGGKTPELSKEIKPETPPPNEAKKPEIDVNEAKKTEIDIKEAKINKPIQLPPPPPPTLPPPPPFPLAVPVQGKIAILVLNEGNQSDSDIAWAIEATLSAEVDGITPMVPTASPATIDGLKRGSFSSLPTDGRTPWGAEHLLVVKAQLKKLAGSSARFESLSLSLSADLIVATDRSIAKRISETQTGRGISTQQALAQASERCLGELTTFLKDNKNEVN